MPHQAQLYHWTSLEIVGKNAWLLIPTATVIATQMGLLLRARWREHHTWFVMASFLWLAAQWAGLQWPEAHWGQVLINTRPLLMVPLALMAGLVISADWTMVRLFLVVFLVQGLLQGVIGLLHVYVFPEFVTGTFAHMRGVNYFVTEDWLRYTSRESGTLGNPSAYAEMIVLGAFAGCRLLAIDGMVRSSRGFWVVSLGLCLLMTLAILPSLSRASTVFVLVPFMMILMGKLSCDVKGRYSAVLLGALIVLIVLFVLTSYPQLFQRFTIEGMYGRTQKNTMLFDALTEDSRVFFFGLPVFQVLTLRTPEGMGFGDNSYLRLAAACGWPLFLAWILLLAQIWHSAPRNVGESLTASGLRVTFFIYLLAQLYLGDVLFNDGWMLMAVMLLGVYLQPSASSPPGNPQKNLNALPASFNSKESL
jgi:hypothetical protein